MALLQLIEQVLVLGPAGAPSRTMDVLIDGDTFAAIAPRLDLRDARVDERTDGRGMLMMPGLINAHHHSHDRFDKGRFSGLPLELWMGLYNPPTAPRRWSAREVYLRTLLNGAEMLKGGITTVQDDIHFGADMDPAVVQAAFQAYADLGMRADVGVAWSDLPFEQGIPHLACHLGADATAAPMPAARVVELWQALARTWDGRVRFVFSPSGPQRCSLAFMERTWALAAAHGRPVTVHVLETRIQALTAQRRYGMPMVEFMHRHGLLTRQTVLAHGVWLTPGEAELIAEVGASVVHNPACNLKLGSGIAPVGALLDLGVAVGLGTDNNNGNDLNSMFDAMRLAALISGVGRAGEAAPVDAARALAMATAGGARALGLERVTGAIEVGKQADFVLLDLGTSAFLPLNDTPRQLVFCEQGNSVRRVYVAGRKLLDGARVTSIDEGALLDELRSRLPDIAARVAAGAAAAEALEPALLAAYRACLRDPWLLPLLDTTNSYQPKPRRRGTYKDA